ncbi:MAG TPA: FGGY-family carbohydrate kinase [Anaeromyxobacter sp.]|nr:FGGY-family carbohydrate kinase [Anaeromyxobacter sp.]
MDCVLGIDLGSASTKAVAFARGGRRLSRSARPMTVARLDPDHPDFLFWNPEAVWDNARAAVSEVLRALPPRARVCGVAVTGLGMDGLPVDEEGNALYPFISWRCPRTAETSARVAERLGRERIFQIAGKQVQPHDTLYRLVWMREHRPSLLDRAAAWLLIEDWLAFRLCGSRATDPTMASSTSLFDQRTGGWSAELAGEAGVPLQLLPAVKPCGALLGEVGSEAARATSLCPGTPVFLGGHDYLCAALGEGVVAPGEVLDIVGTWELSVAATSAPALRPEVFRAGLTVEASVVRGTYAATGFAVAGGAAEWYRRELTAFGGGWEELGQLADSAPPGARGALFLPHLEGAGSPYNDPDSLGALVGLSAACDRACLARALYEGLAYQSTELVEAVTGASGAGPSRVVVTGGLAQSGLFGRIKADLLGRPLWISELEDATALGAALLAELGLGWHRDARAASASVERRGHSLEPGPLAKDYQRRRDLYRSLYPALRPIDRSIRGRSNDHGPEARR